MNTALLEKITFNPQQCGGKSCIRGMRIRVSDVLQLLDMSNEIAQSDFVTILFKINTPPMLTLRPFRKGDEYDIVKNANSHEVFKKRLADIRQAFSF